MQRTTMRFGHEVFFESAIVGQDEKGVLYIRSTGLHGPVQVVRIKPAEYAMVVAHMATRITKPTQGTPRSKKEFSLVDQFERTEFGEAEPPAIPDNAVFRQRVRVIAVQPTAPDQPQFRVRRREPV